MFSLHHHNKNKNQFTLCEDSLTSSVFDLLKYLPDEIFSEILKNSLFHRKIVEENFIIENVSYWDKWDALNTTNTNYVEPDLFIRTNKFDLIIEAKRNDYFQQSESQLRNEVIAYLNEFGSDNKKIYFLQVGGIYGTADIEDFQIDYNGKRNIIILITNWSRILEAVLHTRDKITQLNSTTGNHLLRILDDLVDAFAYHQFFSVVWLNQIRSKKIVSTSFPKLKFTNKLNLFWLNNIKEININNNWSQDFFEYVRN